MFIPTKPSPMPDGSHHIGYAVGLTSREEIIDGMKQQGTVQTKPIAPNRIGTSPLEEAFIRLDANIERSQVLAYRSANVAVRLAGEEPENATDSERAEAYHGSGVTASMHERLDRMSRWLDVIEHHVGRLESL